MAAEAVRQIESMPRPWLAYVAFHAVHTPVDAPDDFKRLYEGVKFHEDPVKNDSRRRLAAMASQLDAKVGEFVAALARTGQRENTLIVFTSDNGGIESAENPYVSEVESSPFNSENDPLRGQKNTLYEGGVRVCAFANWPGKLAPRKHAAPMHAVDWFPTLASIVGYKPSRELDWDGVDQWPALSAGAANDVPRDIYIGMKNGHALRHGDWKLIVRARAEPELFNVAVDSYEKNDLAAAEPERVEQLLKLLAAQKAKDNRILPADLAGLPR
jgi:arylsulfatase A-like enzyme